MNNTNFAEMSCIWGGTSRGCTTAKVIIALSNWHLCQRCSRNSLHMSIRKRTTSAMLCMDRTKHSEILAATCMASKNGPLEGPKRS